MQLGAVTRLCMMLRNNTTSAWAEGDFIVLDSNDSATFVDADAIILDPLGNQTLTIAPSGEPLATTDPKTVGGICLAPAAPDTNGLILVFGVGLAKVAESGEDVDGTAYGAGSTAGQLTEVGVGGANLPIRAIQIGLIASGGPGTTTGDLRRVFVHCLFSLSGAESEVANPLGGA